MSCPDGAHDGKPAVKPSINPSNDSTDSITSPMEGINSRGGESSMFFCCCPGLFLVLSDLGLLTRHAQGGEPWAALGNQMEGEIKREECRTFMPPGLVASRHHRLLLSSCRNLGESEIVKVKVKCRGEGAAGRGGQRGVIWPSAPSLVGKRVMSPNFISMVSSMS